MFQALISYIDFHDSYTYTFTKGIFSLMFFFYFELESLITYFIANCDHVEQQYEMYSSFEVGKEYK